MLPHLTNTAGLWALLGIPLILAIHFLQHRTRVRLTATMFLLESLAPEAATGRNWDRLRSSRALWLQLLAVLLLAWVLAAPCWVRQDAEQTVVFIMDDSANMYPFREEAVQAVAEDMENIGKQGIPTTWVLMGSRPARLPFYRGNNRNAALQSLPGGCRTPPPTTSPNPCVRRPPWPEPAGSHAWSPAPRNGSLPASRPAAWASRLTTPDLRASHVWKGRESRAGESP